MEAYIDGLPSFLWHTLATALPRRPRQVVNHFQMASYITTKVGLLNSVRELPWFEAVDPEAFYPRAYDLFQPQGRADFLEDFRWTAAEALVLRAAACGQLVGMSLGALDTALRVCESRVLFEKDLVEEDPASGSRPSSRAASRQAARQSDTGEASRSFIHFGMPDKEWEELCAQPALT